jgi:hypothetical protein
MVQVWPLLYDFFHVTVVVLLKCYNVLEMEANRLLNHERLLAVHSSIDKDYKCIRARSASSRTARVEKDWTRTRRHYA